MLNLTHLGTALGATLILWGCAGCGDSQASNTESPSQLENDSGGSNLSNAGHCSQNQECMLVPTGCCAACNPDVDDVRAVLVKDAKPACEAACGPCPELTATDLVSQLRAACIDAVCQVLNLRQQAVTECEQDSDCELRSRNCCNGCGEDPALWLALRKGAVEPSAPECNPIPPCAPCPTDARPIAYCAPDKHCAAGMPEATE